MKPKYEYVEDLGIDDNGKEPDSNYTNQDPDLKPKSWPPYPEFCRHPDKCNGLSYCPRDPTCAD